MSASRRLHPLLAPIRALGYEKATAIVIGILFAVGTAAHLWPPTLPLMVAMTPWFLLGCALAALYPALRARGWPFIAWVALAWAATFALEALGVATGLVFGAYEYGTVL
ncbi:MAG: carotenoid biosynthesis protein, partial [Spirochaetales bacterium]|nr:carotenoid biosynthesis protein [Spirochaetales bacterium]